VSVWGGGSHVIGGGQWKTYGYRDDLAGWGRGRRSTAHDDKGEGDQISRNFTQKQKNTCRYK